MCARLRAYVRVYVRAYVCARACMCARACVYVCARAHVGVVCTFRRNNLVELIFRQEKSLLKEKHDSNLNVLSPFFLQKQIISLIYCDESTLRTEAPSHFGIQIRCWLDQQIPGA